MFSILIVESNDFFRRSFKEILKMYIPSLIIDESADGADILDVIAGKSPDFVFLDIGIVENEGLELVRKIKAFRPDVTVVLLTNRGLPEYRSIAGQYGADHLLVKDSISGAEIAALIKATRARNKKRAAADGRSTGTGPSHRTGSGCIPG